MIRGNEKSFAPVWAANSCALILGSYPSPKSFEQGFYYGHAQNRFWPLLAILAGCPTPTGIPKKTELIIKSNLALWDSLQSCEITGASDSSIKNPVKNNIPALIAKTKIEAVFCNGNASYKYYRQLCEKDTGIKAVCLPSTSPANAAFSMQRLAEIWAPLTKFIYRS